MGKLLLLMLEVIILLATARDLLVLNLNTHPMEGVFRFLNQVVDFSEQVWLDHHLKESLALALQDKVFPELMSMLNK